MGHPGPHYPLLLAIVAGDLALGAEGERLAFG